MRSALFLAVFAVMAGRGDCDPVTPYDPCDGKPCGDPCRVCAPDDPDCVETMVVKACDAKGECVADGTFTCEPQPPPYDPCEGKAQCAACTLCPPGATDCVETAVLKECDAAGQCVESTGQCNPRPYEPCAGLRCGDSCSPCPPPQVCPTFAATACNSAGECATVGTFTCEPPPPPIDPCAGKLCGDACSTCDPAAGMMCPMVMMYCDAAGGCGFAYPVCTTATR